MKKIAVPLFAATLVVCGCSTASSLSSAAPATPAASATPPLITCADISTDLTVVVADLKAEAASFQEAWVTGGHQADLQALVNDVQSAGTSNANDATALEGAASQFYVDASQYLNNNGEFLSPGWQTTYNQVTNDINAMATDCNLPTAPVNNG